MRNFGVLIKYFSVLLSIIVISDCQAEVSDGAINNSKHISFSEIQEQMEMYGEKDCEEAFYYLWPMAKEGNKNARLSLFYSFFSIGLIMPGRSLNNNEHMNDLLIMYINSIDAKKISIDQIKNDPFESAYLNVFLNQKDYISCLEYKRADCEDILIKKKLLPSFESYAEEIDTLLASGLHPTCFGGIESGLEEKGKLIMKPNRKE